MHRKPQGANGFSTTIQNLKVIEWYKGLEYKNIKVLLDENGDIIDRVHVRGYPFNLFLDSDLNVKKTVPGHLGAEQIRVFAEK